MNATDQIQDLGFGLSNDLRGAFPDMVRMLQNGVYSGVLQMTRNRHDAEDVTQETFIRAYRALEGYEAERIRTLRLRPWVWTIALNLCRNRARSASRSGTTVALTDRPAADPGPEDEALEAAGTSEWRHRLAQLSSPQRTAVVLKHVVGLGYSEIGAAMGRPEGTVKADVHRGINRLRTILEQEEETR
jgi:RNA polymerase sigma factor (sigma-70 family)